MQFTGSGRLLPLGILACSLILCLVLAISVSCGAGVDSAVPSAVIPTIGVESGTADTSLDPGATNGTQSSVVPNLPATFTPLATSTRNPYPSHVAAIPPCSSPGQIETRSISSTIAGHDVPIRIYLPPCYGEDGRNYPVIYLLHGGSYDETHWTSLGLIEAAESGIVSELLSPTMIVMPDGGTIADTTSGGPSSYEGFILDELIPFIENNYCASPKGENRAIGGISRGGYWALEIAFRFPNRFASAGGHSAALMDSFAEPDIDPQYTGINNDLSGLRIYLDIGDQDWVINNISALHEEMVAAGIDHTWVLNSGSHNDNYWASHVPEYLDWYTQTWSKDRNSYASCAVSHADSLR